MTRSLLFTARFLEYIRAECHFSNGTDQVRFLERHIYNQEEFMNFDSKVGQYHAVTQLGQPEVEYWNSQKDLLEQKLGQVDAYCRHNYEGAEMFMEQQTGECEGLDSQGEGRREGGRQRETELE